MKRVGLSLTLTLLALAVVVSAAIAYAQYISYLPIVNKQASPTPTRTPTRTNTPTATNTPISTNTPTPTPTMTPPPPVGVSILPNESYYVDSIDYLHVVGEVLNNTSDNLEFVKISMNFFNSNNNLIATDFTYTYLDTLPAWSKTCFEVLLEQPAGWSYYQFEAPTYWTGADPLPNLAVIDDSGSYDPTFGWYDIIGQVRNDEPVTITFVSPVGTLYNASSKVIGCDFTYVNSTDLDPGQISAFEMTFIGRDYADATSYRLQVDGNWP